ncbi:DegV family protein [Negativicoccus succinicivorans]|uniref:DegV family protein n=1 Tax=Negativicoccus succinicivorans TaxID=620903 RepID=UPI002902F5B0|nr:DegV family protein [Negativicoccus succinicivorans]MDU2417362.1 DegV family protein [Negativicoccus succinicivorans]
MIHIICDTTACLNDEFVARHGNLHMIPLYISLGGGETVNDNSISTKEVFESYEATKIQPLTSQPSIGEWMQIFNSIPEEDPIIIITISKIVSGTVQTARVAAKQSKRKHIAVIDSHSTNGGMQILVEEALTMIEDGKDFDTIVAQLHKNIANSITMFMPTDLKYLQRGGRIGKVASLVGSILQIRPILYLESDAIGILDKVRTTKRAMQKMKEKAMSRPIKRLHVATILADELGRQFKRELESELPDVTITHSEGSPVLGAHLGPQVVSLMLEWEHEDGTEEDTHVQ